MAVPENCKVFVGGILRETTDEVLKEHFSKYGTVTECVIAKDRFSGWLRGFAFVTFSESIASQRALQDSHEILGRKVDVKRAVRRSSQQCERNGTNGYEHRSSDQIRTKKIFVGGLSANLTEEEFRSYFEKFGRINDVVVMHDNVTHKPRGFGFVTFDSEESAEEALHESFHELNGRRVEVKKAVPKDGSISNGGRGPYVNWYPQGIYHPPPFGYDSVARYGGGYPPGGYNGIGYGLPPIVSGSAWGHTTINFMGGMYPYGAPIYPAFSNGWAGGAPYFASFDSGFGEKSPRSETWDVQGAAGESMFSQSVNEEVDSSSSSGGGLQAAADEEDQNNIDQSHPVCSS